MREEGLEHLRQRNFQQLEAELAARVTSTGHPRPTLLDVGCAHGWFLQASSAHFQGTGIEPDARVADAAAARDVDVRKGFFPDVLGSGERFDVIVFNDVLEHIPDVGAALRACHQHLLPGAGWWSTHRPARACCTEYRAGLLGWACRRRSTGCGNRAFHLRMCTIWMMPA
ncbi:class I SAM-dependent methyltransferase [Stenotrophomonas indicatrix]